MKNARFALNTAPCIKSYDIATNDRLCILVYTAPKKSALNFKLLHPIIYIYIYYGVLEIGNPMTQVICSHTVLFQAICGWRTWSYIIKSYKILSDITDDVIKWKHFLGYWPFVRGIHRSPVDSPHQGQWRGALMYSLICEWTNGWANNRNDGDLRRHRTHFDVTVMNSYR